MSMLKGKGAIVTGGGRGIGRAVVDRLLADGAWVLTCGRGMRPEDLLSEVGWVQADVSLTCDARRIVASALELFDDVSILVNNAGVQIERTVADTSDEDWNLVVGTTARACSTCAERCCLS